MSTREIERFDYDLNFQARMVRVLFQEPDFTITLGSFLKPEHFEKRVHRWCAQTILDYAEKHTHGISHDALEIEARRALRTGRIAPKEEKAVLAFVDKTTRPVKDKSFIKEELFRFVKNQVTKDAILDSVDMLKDGDYEAIDSNFQRVLDVQSSFEGGLGHSLVGDREERYKRRKEWVPDGVPTGIAGIDDLMKPGGLPPKQVGGVVAAPGSGKTNTLIHMGRSAVIEGQAPVLHFSLELAEEVIVDRYDAAFTGVPINDLERGKNPAKVRRYMKHLGEDLGGEPIVVKEFAAGQMTVANLISHTRQLESKGFYPGMVIVDYAGLLQPSVVTGNSYVDLGRVVIELRAWAKALEVPIWTAFQGNKLSLGKEVITMKELADSFQSAMHSDVLMALCQTDDEKLRNKARFFLMKNRNGIAEQSVPVRLNWASPRVHSLGTASRAA